MAQNERQTDTRSSQSRLNLLNQMAGPMTWELAVDLAESLGNVGLLTGHPDTLAKTPPAGLSISPANAYKRGGVIKRFSCWTQYMWKAFFWLWRLPRNTPVLVFSNPPMGVWVTAAMRSLRGTRYAVMVHDIYPDVAIRMKVATERNLFIRLWRRINRWAYEKADVVMTLGENMRATLSQQFDAEKTPAGEIPVIYPWADTNRFAPINKQDNAFAQSHDQCDKITIMYSGNMGLGHDIETMLAAAEQLQHETRLHFMFIGDGPKWHTVHQRLEESPLPNVTLLPWQDESTIPQSLAAADIAFVSLEPELAALAIPSKAFYFLATGAPIMLLSPTETELANIIERFGCGWVKSPGDAEGLIGILRDVCDGKVNLEDIRAASRDASKTIGNRSVNSQQILDTLRKHLPIAGPDSSAESPAAPPIPESAT